MALPLAAAAVASLVPSAVKIFQGIRQKKDARGIDATRPVYDIPQEYQDVASMAALEAFSSGFRGQDIAKARIDSTYATGLESISQNITNPAERAAAVAGLTSTRQDSMNRLTELAMADQSRANRQYANALRDMGRQREKQFQLNELDPFYAAAAAKRALTGAGNQNIYGGLTDVASLGTQLLMGIGNNQDITPAGSMSATGIDVNTPEYQAALSKTYTNNDPFNPYTETTFVPNQNTLFNQINAAQAAADRYQTGFYR